MKRWIIRSFFIGLLVLCVGGWAVSYLRDVAVVHGHHKTHVYFVEISGGTICHGRVVSYYGVAPEDAPSWDTYFTPPYLTPHSASSLSWLNRPPYLLGFGYMWEHYPVEYNRYGFCIPFWFLTSLCAALLWLVWRKTREKTKGRAFPVELEKPRGES